MVTKGAVKLKAPIKISSPNIICECTKPAEDTNAVVLRLYECEGSLTECGIDVGSKRAFLLNFMEDASEEILIENGAIRLSFRPFEIKTVMLQA